MKKYSLDVDDFCEDLFHFMEEIQDGKHGHKIEFHGSINKEFCADHIAGLLKPFIENKLCEITTGNEE